MLDAVIQYVEAVLDGTQESDNSVGRALNDMVSWTVSLYWALTYFLCENRCSPCPRWIQTSLK